MRKLALLLAAILVVSAVCSGTTQVASAQQAKVSLYLGGDPVYADVSSREIPLYSLIAAFDGQDRSAVEFCVTSPHFATVTSKGHWRVLKDQTGFSGKAEFDTAWSALSRREWSTSEAAQRLSNLMVSNRSDFDLVTVSIKTPVNTKPGDKIPYKVQAELDNGETIAASGTIIMQSMTAPTGWLGGDTHVHTGYSDGLGWFDGLRSGSESRGLKFAYVTDHIDLIRRAGQSWLDYVYQCRAYSAGTPKFTLAPGLEVTCADSDDLDTTPDGDCLGFGLPLVQDPTNVQNYGNSCLGTVQAIDSYPGATACIAHPAGPGIGWVNPGSLQRGVQVAIGDGQTFWQYSMNTRGYQSAAFGGSDRHNGVFGTSSAVTWVYAPTWASAPTWDASVTAISQAICGGTTAASTDESLAYFTIGNRYPGDDYAAPIGSSAYYTVYVCPVNTGENIRATWTLYREGTQISSVTTPILAAGQTYTSPSLATTVQTDTNAYYLKVAIQHLDPLSNTLNYTTYAYCGPTFITGQ